MREYHSHSGELEDYLDQKTNEAYGRYPALAQFWKNYMLDPKRGEEIYGWLSEIGAWKKNPMILEVGCGFGAVMEGLVVHTPRIYGIELQEDRSFFSQRRLEIKTRQIGGSLEGGIAQANGLNIPFRSSAFDILLCIDVLEHIPTQHHGILLAEIARVLKSKGILFLTVSNRLALRDNHNGGLILATWLPERLHELYVRLFVQSIKYIPTWDRTSFGVANLVHRNGFRRFDEKPLWRFALRHIFHHFHRMMLIKHD